MLRLVALSKVISAPESIQLVVLDPGLGFFSVGQGRRGGRGVRERIVNLKSLLCCQRRQM